MSIRSLNTIKTTDETRDVLTAVLAAAKCACGQTARRVVIERDPVSIGRWTSGESNKTRRKRDERRNTKRVTIKTWCGDIDAHEHDWDEGATNIADSVAMNEDDM